MKSALKTAFSAQLKSVPKMELSAQLLACAEKSIFDTLFDNLSITQFLASFSAKLKVMHCPQGLLAGSPKQCLGGPLCVNLQLSALLDWCESQAGAFLDR